MVVCLHLIYTGACYKWETSVAGHLHLVVRAIKGSEGKTQFCIYVWMSLDHIVGSIRVDIKELSELRLDQAMEGKLGDTRGGSIPWA